MPENLKTHMKLHSEEKPCMCGQCSMAFTASQETYVEEWVIGGEDNLMGLNILLIYSGQSYFSKVSVIPQMLETRNGSQDTLVSHIS